MHPLHTQIRRFVPLSAADFGRVLPAFDPLKLRRGACLIQPGEPVTSEYYVIRGCLKAWVRSADDRLLILQFGLPGWWITDYAALYTAQPASLSLDCIREAEVLRLSAAHREALCREVPGMETFFRMRTNHGYIALQQRILSLMQDSVQVRYDAMLHTYPDLFQLVPQTQIAAWLGVSRETLSRLHRRSKS